MRLFNTPQGKVIVSVLWGLGIATLFRKVCNDNCIIIQAENPKEVAKKIYQVNDSQGTRCVKYSPQIVNCNVTK